jgi:hypothetical protein
VLEEHGLSADMNYLLDPRGVETPCPGMSHVGEAQRIMSERGSQLDPDLALDGLIKEGWIRVSGNVFEFVPTAGWKERISAFIGRHKDYYRNEPYLELDNRAKGYSRQVPTSSIFKDYDMDTPAAQRADEMSRWRRDY